MEAMRAEIRADGTVRLSGYVNVCERDSRPIPYQRGAFIERVAQGAFSRAIERAGGNIELRYNHGRTVGKQGDNLALREDNIGLYGEAVVSDQEVVQAARDGKLTGWSFRFYTRPGGDEWTEGENGVEHRRLTEIDIDEVSILTVTPAYYATSIEMRDGETSLAEERTAQIGEITDFREPDNEPTPEPADSGADMRAVYAAELEYYKYKGASK
ncbi:MAG: HK97 family phage prohead protease [Clostridia bacterium]|nr:HK97 family phage prohead protease [Clostridia bacterium]